MYTLTDERVMYVPPVVRNKLVELAIQPGELFTICKAERKEGNRRFIEWHVKKDDTPNGQPIGHVVDTRDAVTPIGTGTVVFLDLGEDNGLNPGDFLTVFHPSGKAEGVRTVLGEAAILATRKRASVAIITSMKDNIAVGDWVELK